MLVRIEAEELQCQRDEKAEKKKKNHVTSQDGQIPVPNTTSVSSTPTTSTSLADAEIIKSN